MPPSHPRTTHDADVPGQSWIQVKGARVHNLKGVDVDIPRNSLVAVCGVSGSGKSSLAFDTVFAEGQRRYVESLSAYARQFLGQHAKPDVDSIEGLSPAVSIDQKSVGHNPRSTVGTVTEIWDYLRVLYARCGQAHCQDCGAPMQAMSIAQIRRNIDEEFADQEVLVVAPLVRSRKGAHADLLAGLAARGFTRLIVDGTQARIDELSPLDSRRRHDIDLVVDRIRIPSKGDRLVSSLETATTESGGYVLACSETQERSYSTETSCPRCRAAGIPLEPRSFSFNAPQGACPECSGLGSYLQPAEDLVLASQTASLADGVVVPWAESSAAANYLAMLTQVCAATGGGMSTPWNELPESTRRTVLHGDPELRVAATFGSGVYERHYSTRFEGVFPYLVRRLNETQGESFREKVLRFFQSVPCAACNGTRLRKEVRGVLFSGKSITDVASIPVDQLSAWLRSAQLVPEQEEVAAPLLREISSRVAFLEQVGLGYLTLSRSAATLSGGESQRIRLASQIGSALTGVLYVLDEPSIGLHQSDNAALLKTLTHLRDLGNTVLVVEHDEDTLRASDWAIEIGPLAGQDGGRLVYSGPVDPWVSSAPTLTAEYLRGDRAIATPGTRRPGTGRIVVRRPRGNNLTMDAAEFPLGTLTVVTGVSGSGKSTLVGDTLAPALLRHLHRAVTLPAPCDGVDGMDQVDKVVLVDQSPIGRTPRSNPATYTGVFDKVRSLFASTELARARGYQPGRFSFNVAGGRCSVCSGDGVTRVEMSFLPDVFVVCSECSGTRFNDATLEVKYRGKSIADVLSMTVQDAREFFAAVPAVARQLQTLVDVGMGYVAVGQAATTLSGGEAQRVKLANELQRRATGRTVYILDEPTTGLHFEDVRKLLLVLDRLVSTGNTVIVIEHNLDVIRSADHVIDLGPGGGPGGGRIVAQGTPEEVAEAGTLTGGHLARALSRSEEQARMVRPAS